MKRIVTHTDFDGLISALLLRDILGVEQVVFTEPWLIQQGDFIAEPGDIIVDLPYHENCSLWIDHHKSNEETAAQIKKERPDCVIFDATKKSCPSLLYEAYHEKHPFLDEEATQEMIVAADKIDSASFSREDLVHPDSWGHISMSLKSDDKRKDDEYRQFLLNILSFQPVDKVIEQPLVKKRIAQKQEEQDKWKDNIKKYVRVEKDIIIVDLTEVEALGSAPPFMIYTLYPDLPLSITLGVIKDDDERYKISVGKNIFHRENPHPADIGAIMKKHGGGGHEAVGGCSCAREEKDSFVKQLIKELTNTHK